MLRDYKEYGRVLKVYNVGTGEKKYLRVYPDDMISHIQKMISVNFDTPINYQLIFRDNGDVLGFSYPGVRLRVPEDYDLRKPSNDRIMTDLSRDIFPDASSINLLLIDEYIQSNFASINEYEIHELFNDIKTYWPNITIEDISGIVAGKKKKLRDFEDSSSEFYKFIESIAVKDIRKKMIIDNIMRVRSRVKYRFEDRIDLNYIFDQAVPDKEIIIFRPSKSLIIRKYNEQRKSTVPVALQNVIPSVKIGENTLLFDEYVSTNDVDILRKVEIVLGKKHIYAEDSNKYVFSIQYYKHGFSTSEYAKFMRKFSKDVLEQDPKNIGHSNEYVFFYKRVPEHVYVSIKGHNLVNISIEGISKSNIDTLFNFIVRTLYSMTEEVRDHSLTNVKGMLKQYDPILYGYHKKDTVSGKLFSRKVLNAKFPIVFQKGSKILDNYIEEYRNKNGGSTPKTLEYHNFTTGGTNVYICPNKKYHNFIFRTPFDHPRHLCTISCGVKEQKDRALIAACKKGIPFMPDELEREVTLGDVSNLYYIRQFSNEKNLQTNKLSRLPIALNKIFNTQCQITNNLISVGSVCNLMCGSIDDREFHLTVYHVLPEVKKIPFTENQWDFVLGYYALGINIVLIEYNAITKDINFAQFIEQNALIRALQEMKTVFVLRVVSNLGTYYSTIAKLEQPQKKRYILHKTYTAADQIVKTMIHVTGRLRSRHVDFITIGDLISNGIPFTQIRQSGTNLIVAVIIDRIIFPIVPSHINIYYPSLLTGDNISDPNYDHGDLIKLIAKLDGIHKIRITSVTYEGSTGEYFGYYLNEDFFVRFIDGPKRFSVPAVPMYFVENTYRRRVKPVDFHLNKEIYDTYLFHVSAWINETVVKINTMDEWKVRLLKIYGSEKDPDFISDYDNLHRKNYDHVTALKPWKLEIMRATSYKEVDAIIVRMVNGRITFGSDLDVNESNYRKLCPEEGTIDGQCKGKKLVIPKKLFTDYTRLISMQIMFDKQKRHDILAGTVPNIVDFRNYSTTPGVKIEKTYILDAEYIN